MTHVDEIAARDLFLYAANNQTLYNRYVQPIINSFRRKVKKGIFNAELAPKAFDTCVKNAAMQYCKEFGSPN